MKRVDLSLWFPGLRAWLRATPGHRPVWREIRLHARILKAAPVVSLPPPPAWSIAGLELSYAPPEDAVPEPEFRARLAACRACNLWDEPSLQGQGRCQSVACNCARRVLFRPSEFCPERRWTVA